MKPLLQVTDLCKEFPAGGLLGRKRVCVLDRVSLEVFPGETLGLVGESGCGKTTLARCAMRLVEPTSGAVFFDGCDLLGLSGDELRLRRREFQMIFQDAAAALNPSMTAGEILSEPLAVHRIGSLRDRRQRVLEEMGAVALDAGLLGRLPGQLSGGQQQRLVIARALVLRPRLVVADEPVSALDASVQAQILNLLAEIRSRCGLTLLLISHSLPVIHYLCSRVAVMYLGRLVEVGAAEAFFRQPRHPYSQALLQSLPSFDLAEEAAGQGLQGEMPAHDHPPAGCRFHPRCPSATDRCRAADPPMTSLPGGGQVACFLYS